MMLMWVPIIQKKSETYTKLQRSHLVESFGSKYNKLNAELNNVQYMMSKAIKKRQDD